MNNNNNTSKSRDEQNGNKSSGGWSLPDPDDVGAPVPAEPIGEQFRSVPTVSTLPMATPFARPGEGTFLDAPFIGQPPPIHLQTSRYCDDFTYRNELCPFEKDQRKAEAADQSVWSTGSSPWYLEEIETLPLYYPLEQTSKSFRLDGKSVTIISITENITNCLKAMSIQPKYIEDEASVALLTLENIEMYLCLWKTNDEKSIVVEIQRRRGCSITFHGYCNHILDAAGGNFVPPESNNDVDLESLKKAEDILVREVSVSKINTNDVVDRNKKDESVSAIEMAQDLLKTAGNANAQLLGMESLRILTDPRKTSIDTAIMTSRAVLFGSLGVDCGSQESQNMFDATREIILTNVLDHNQGSTENKATPADKMDICYDTDDDFFFDGDSDLDGVPPNMKDVFAVMQILSLTIIANSLGLLFNAVSMGIGPEWETKVTPNDIAVRFLAETNEIALKKAFKRQDILSSLIYELGRAGTKSHHAYLAAASLRHLCETSKTATENALNLGMKEMCEKAHKVGKEIHVNLETETEKLRKVYTSKQ